MVFETLKVSSEAAILFVDIAAPPMNLLGPALVRDVRFPAEGGIELSAWLFVPDHHAASHEISWYRTDGRSFCRNGIAVVTTEEIVTSISAITDSRESAEPSIGIL